MKNQTPSQFKTPRRTLLMDRWMNHGIKLGGIMVIVAVLGIFVFIFSQVFPLFQAPKIQAMKTWQLPANQYVLLAMDEWGEKPFVVTQKGEIYFLDAKTGKVHHQQKLFLEAKTITAFDYHSKSQTLVLGTDQGEIAFIKILYKPVFYNETREIQPSIQASPWFSLKYETEDSSANLPVIRQIAYGEEEELAQLSVLIEVQDESGTTQKKVWVLALSEESSLLGESKKKIEKLSELSLPNRPQEIKLNENGEILLVSSVKGEVFYFYNDGDQFFLKQTFIPFGNFQETGHPRVGGDPVDDRLDSRLRGNDVNIFSMNFILGGVSVYFTDFKGNNQLYSLFIGPEKKGRLFGLTKQFSPLPGQAEFFAKSLRNKSFLVGRDNFVRLNHATTEEVRWEKRLPFKVQQLALSKKYHRLAFLAQDNRFHLYRLQDPHPEGGWRAYFNQLWYEGAPEPSYVWQSTGGSDSFEPKLSLIPLIIGTLKGTFYALVFALPIALLAAFYTSQFLHPRLKKVIKPTMEIMASLPSVILGFLAALWLAPLLEEKVPSLLLIVVLLPLAVVIFSGILNQIPFHRRAWLSEGQEWLVLIPFLLVLTWIGWELGPVLEQYLFVATDPSTGIQVADFRLWWPQVTGTPFEQRNSLVVGFIMGFAVIPIIFTISEDSLSAVPKNLRSASLALGASRWQTGFRVVLPAAMAGIFSAVMIGFGRAVGETMIVLMATGNTPIMDFNIFSGMRTLSANLAVELPEAPMGGTLYRTLFLGALVLFLMTFVLNSIAEVMRQRIRKKFKGL